MKIKELLIITKIFLSLTILAVLCSCETTDSSTDKIQGASTENAEFENVCARIDSINHFYRSETTQTRGCGA